MTRSPGNGILETSLGLAMICRCRTPRQHAGSRFFVLALDKPALHTSCMLNLHKPFVNVQGDQWNSMTQNLLTRKGTENVISDAYCLCLSLQLLPATPLPRPIGQSFPAGAGEQTIRLAA
jgi:hypothetical protein